MTMLRILAALTAVAACAGWAVLIAAHTLSNANRSVANVVGTAPQHAEFSGVRVMMGVTR